MLIFSFFHFNNKAELSKSLPLKQSSLVSTQKNSTPQSLRRACLTKKRQACDSQIESQGDESTSTKNSIDILSQPNSEFFLSPKQV